MLRFATLTALFAFACGGGSGASPEAICKKMMELAKKDGLDMSGKEGAMEECTKEMEEEKKKMGDDTWKKVSSCFMKLDSMEQMDRCDPEKLGGGKKGDDNAKAEGGGDDSQAKAKATEAEQFVKKLYDGARAYYMDAPSGGGMTPTEPQFPNPSVGPTPPLGSCCEAGGKCAPNAEAWAAPTWMVLQFSVDDPHYYSYEYKVSDDNKSFEAMAYGDLDCDGEYSTFKLSGKVSGDGPAPAGAIEKTNPLE